MSQMASAPSPDLDRFSSFFYGAATKAVHLARFLGAEDPEDVVQEAFCRLFASRHRLDDRDPTPYLNRIVVNEVRDRARRRSTREKFAPVLSVVPDPPSDTDRHDTRDALMQAVAGLPQRQREVVVLRFWLDLSLQDIATTTGTALGTVKSHLSRALTALRIEQEDLR